MQRNQGNTSCEVAGQGWRDEAREKLNAMEGKGVRVGGGGDRNFHKNVDEVLVKIRRGGRRVLVGT